MDSVVSDSVASPRFRAALLTSFAVVAMVLATLGVYGVIAYSVSRQQRDVAIRLARGAARGNVIRQVVREGITPVIAGLLIGGVAALWVGQLMGSLLFGVSAADPVAFLAVPVVLLGAATLAAYLPARRAAALDPMTALRSE